MLSSFSEINPIIDVNGILYVGTNEGKIHVFTSSVKEFPIIFISSPVTFLVIGSNESIVVITKEGTIRLIG